MGVDTSKAITTMRRTLEQVKHCVEEALSAETASEDPRHIFNDLEQAHALLEERLLPHYRAMARGAGR